MPEEFGTAGRVVLAASTNASMVVADRDGVSFTVTTAACREQRHGERVPRRHVMSP